MESSILFLASLGGLIALKQLRSTFTEQKQPKQQQVRQDFMILFHGGAGVIDKGTDPTPYTNALERIAKASFSYAKAAVHQDESKRPIDVVEFVVKLLEDEPLFNAGCGAVFAANGQHELEASIMDGSPPHQCGACSMVKTVKNPISLARAVFTHTKHNYLIGEAVEELAAEVGLERVTNTYYSTEKRRQQLENDKRSGLVSIDHAALAKSDVDAVQQAPAASVATAPAPAALKADVKGTVGCVVMIRDQGVAAGTSTGGMSNKRGGRIGDTPLIGAGTFADNKTCAVSATGWGEEFMRRVAAHRYFVNVVINRTRTHTFTHTK